MLFFGLETLPELPLVQDSRREQTKNAETLASGRTGSY